MKKSLYILLGLFLIAANASASGASDLKLCRVFSDGMVIQQQSEVAIWGKAKPGSTVSVIGTWERAKTARCKVAKDSTWKVSIATPQASYRPYEVLVMHRGDTLVLNDVLVGEVWFASGQSNMEMPMRGFFNCPVKDAQKFIAGPPAIDRIRMFTVKKKQSYEPLDDVEGTWNGACPSTIAEMSATAYFFARQLNETLNIPVGIVTSAYGGARVESWTPKDILETYPDEDLTREHIESMTDYIRPYLAYNAMLNPLKGLTIRGFIWYQGCSNVGKHEQFVERMKNMVARWRSDWGDENARLPFYQVEIAPCTDYWTDGVTSYPALLRQAQHTAAQEIPNSAIVVTNDLAEPYEAWNIHPSQKQPVGERLAYLALHRDYGIMGIPCYSPEVVSALIVEDESKSTPTVGIELTEVQWNGLNRIHEIEGLEICGPDGVWHKVTDAAYSWEQNVLKVNSPEVSEPVAVRYGWGDFCPGNLASALSGLPVTPFNVKVGFAVLY